MNIVMKIAVVVFTVLPVMTLLVSKVRIWYKNKRLIESEVRKKVIEEMEYSFTGSDIELINVNKKIENEKL